MSKKGSGFGKFLAGAAIGAGLGLLLAPKSGEETRKDLKRELNKLVAQAKQIDVVEVKDQFLAKVEEIKEELADLDKETAIELAKKKGEELKVKAQELCDLAVEKGTPVLKSAAEEVRVKAIAVSKQVTKKLENAGKTEKTKKSTKKDAE